MRFVRPIQIFKFAEHYLFTIEKSVPSSKNCEWIRYLKAARLPTLFAVILWCPYPAYEWGLWEYIKDVYYYNRRVEKYVRANSKFFLYKEMSLITDVVVGGVAALLILLALILVQYDKYKRRRTTTIVGTFNHPLHSNYFRYLEHCLLMVISLIPPIFLIAS